MPSGQSVSWSSDDESTATVSDGTVYGVSAGTTTIRAEFEYNGKTYQKTCTVSVTRTELPKYTVSVKCGSGVSSVSGGGSYTAGTQVQVTAKARDYYTFSNWNSDNYEVSDSGSASYTFTMPESNVTLTAYATKNELSDWVEESNVPAGAQKVEYAYSYTETKESKSANEAKDGWKSAGDRLGENYGPWSEWSKTKAPKKAGREFDTEYKTVYWYKRYRYYNEAKKATYFTYNDVWVKNQGYSGKWEYKSSSSQLPFVKYAPDTKIPEYGESDNYWFKADINNRGEHTEFEVKTPDKYRYRDKETIYLYERTVEKSPTYPSGSGISNVKTYVRYRKK